MQVLLSEVIDLEQVADLCAVGNQRSLPAPRDRSKPHVTNLLESARLIAKGENRYYEYEGQPAGIMSMGRIWELATDCYLTRYARSKCGFYVPDVEHEQDGVVASLDGMMFLPDFGVMVVESKLRFTAGAEIPLRHLQQVRAYCYLLKTSLVCYVSCHLSSTPPTASAYLRIIKLTEDSIRETWGLVVETRRYLESVGRVPGGVMKLE